MQALYSPRLDEALALAAGAFRHIARKGTRVPYLSHLMIVAAQVAEHGGDEEQIIAALLHDYLEDIPGADAAELEQRFGARVSRLVLALSDATSQPKPPWKARKLRYLAQLEHEPAEVKLISAADKLHNATSLLRELEAVGEAVWQRFSAPREESLWYLRAAHAALAKGWAHPLLDELERVVRRLHGAAGVPWP